MPDKEKLIPIDIEEEMKSSFLDYSMSVIISRALPDVRDGLKPVHRRILVTLRDLNLYHNRPFRKCAKIAGDVSGNYHPHGEAIVYPSLVRMAQDFSLRYPLIDGQGNFGSVDGDPPAAMRYTEARMTRIGGEMLQDIDKETVDYIPNYDGSRTEPTVLPSAIPNLLINGSSGIAVGMATNIPPHNLGEVVDGLIRLIKNPQTSIDELIQVIRAPDFPTGGYIYGIEGVKEAYLTGRGIIQIRARVMVEELKKGEKVSLIINEIPYQINKTNLLEKIAQLVKDKVLDDVADLRDESDREGMRIVLELKKGVNPDITLKKLYTHTQLQITFGIIMLAIANNQPKVFNLKELLQAFVEHRKEVLTRRTLFDLKKAEERLHILEGLKIALDHLDEVITLIRRSKAPEEAKKKLMSRYKLTAIQAQAILDIRLQRLTAMERSKILEERREVLRSIARFEELLANEQLIMNLIEEDLLRIKKEYGDKRRATIIEQTVEIDPEDLIPEEDMV
ncbi:MAG: DNA topoisomerase (ATP-hydrolyzing), partial [Acidobacteriota bacterium]